MDSRETTHAIHVDDARSMDALADDSVELVVTSPPYPMIEMWDDLFVDLDPDIGAALDREDGEAAFRLMHAQLREVFAEVERVLVDGGIACVNVGDATRSVGGDFRVYQNHARVVEAFADLGFTPLPEILWRKPANSAAKFVGSGMLPPNAYATLEHEYLLVFRNGPEPRQFEPGARRRYESAYFWEERNRWFSDLWTDVAGTLQALEHDDLRDRSAAYPLEIPFRLVNMYSVYGDTVLDPFWGTGTTTLATMAAARHSVGYEIDPAFVDAFADRVETVEDLAGRIARSRLDSHREFVAAEQEAGREFAYRAETYDVPVRTRQEQSIRLYEVADRRRTADGYHIRHEVVEGSDGSGNSQGA